MFQKEGVVIDPSYVFICWPMFLVYLDEKIPDEGQTVNLRNKGEVEMFFVNKKSSTPFVYDMTFV